MKRKFVVYLSAVIAVALIITAVYFLTRPSKAPVITRVTTSNDIQSSDVNQFVYDQNSSVCFFFYSSEDTDSQFVIKQMLDVIKSEYAITTFSKLYYVDLAESDYLDNSNKLMNKWGFSSYPTFLVMKIDKSNVTVTDKLEWNSTSPYTIASVRNWLKSHSLLNNN